MASLTTLFLYFNLNSFKSFVLNILHFGIWLTLCLGVGESRGREQLLDPRKKPPSEISPASLDQVQHHNDNAKMAGASIA